MEQLHGDRASCFRELYKLKVKLKETKCDVQKYRKRCQRLRSTVVKSTPRKIASKMMTWSPKLKFVHRALEFHHAG